MKPSRSIALFDRSEEVYAALPLIEVEELDVEEITLDAADACREILEG